MTAQGLAGRRHIALRGKRRFALISAQGKVRDRSDGSDSRLRPDGSQQAIDDADRILIKLLPREGAFAGENVVGAKAGRHGHYLFEAQPEERGTCK
jgi:hypothetical protein